MLILSALQHKDITLPVFDKSQIAVRSRSLPHWEQEGGVYFVTFRTDDSVPVELLRAYEDEKRRLERFMSDAARDQLKEKHREKVRLYCRVIDRTLDTGLGACPVKGPAHASFMASVVAHFDRERYDLFAYAVMPNHVHAVLRCLGDHHLDDIMHSWKSFSATKLNRMLARRGTFWQREYFDHLIRDQDDLLRFCRYVRDNPRKAGLKDWPWSWVADEVGFLPPG